MKTSALLCSFLLLASQSLFGFALEGQSWTLNRTVVMQLSLGGPRPLSDGFASFNESAQDVLNLWNAHLEHLQFAAVLASPVVPEAGDDEMSAFFTPDVYGEKFGSGVLAVTLLTFRGTVLEESDTLFNATYTWDSYNGDFRSGVIDFHRVALHEFGHTLGLDHPDQAGQTVAAIMNSHVGDLYTLQPDDIAGVGSLYDNGPPYQSGVVAPVLANISTRALIGTGDNALIGGFIVQGTEPATVILRGIGLSLSAVGITNAISDPVITVFDSNQRQVATNDDWFTSTNAVTIGSFRLDPPNSRESALYLTLAPGAYTVVMEGFVTPGSGVPTGVGLFELYDLHTTGGRAGNISTRGQVLGGGSILIGGFIIGGSASKTVIARAIGPSLGAAGITTPLANPNLELRDSNGNLIQVNDDWQKSPDAQLITDAGLAPTDPKESAIRATLNPGAYTTLVSGVAGGTGIGLVEVYDISPVP